MYRLGLMLCVKKRTLHSFSKMCMRFMFTENCILCMYKFSGRMNIVWLQRHAESVRWFAFVCMCFLLFRYLPIQISALDSSAGEIHINKCAHFPVWRGVREQLICTGFSKLLYTDDFWYHYFYCVNMYCVEHMCWSIVITYRNVYHAYI